MATSITQKCTSAEILARLRSLMSSLKSENNNSSTTEILHAYIIPSVDAHQSEYIADCDKRLRFVSNFSGSRGLAVVTLNEAALWTDGRYFLQCNKQLDPKCWILMKEGQPETPTLSEWLNKVLPRESCVGVDPKLITLSFYKELRKNLSLGRHKICLHPRNLVDEIWTGKPPLPKHSLQILPFQFSGKRWRQKVHEIRQTMKRNKAGLLVLSALDDIAWLLNLRGNDVPFNPVFFAYCVIGLEHISLFVDKSKISDEILCHLSTNEDASNDEGMDSNEAVDIYPYDQFYDHLKSAVEKFQSYTNNKKINEYNQDDEQYQLLPLIWLPSNSSNMAITSIVTDKSRRLEKMSPVASLKAVKNPVELAGMKNAQIKDCIAHCQFLHWLENEMKNNSTSNSSASGSSTEKQVLLNEIKVAEKFESFRSKQRDYVGLSFDTISASGPNAANCHYKPGQESNAQLSIDQLYLIDSGAQYKDGTTDITRTICFSQPTPYQKECFTMVLKGHIALATVKFPENVNGFMLDSITRMALWNLGLDYLHGTGHGVGHYLCVHEPLVGFGFRSWPYLERLKENMVITIEPGFYEDGQFGIRIESEFVIVPVETKYKFKARKMLTFEPITFVPVQLEMIEKSLLNESEKKWLNDYHSKCLNVLGPVLLQSKETDVYNWLKNACRNID